MNKTLSKILLETNELNVHRQNCLKTKQELKKAIVATHRKYKDITFRTDTLTYIKCLNELTKQQVIDERVHNPDLKENRV